MKCNSHRPRHSPWLLTNPVGPLPGLVGSLSFPGGSLGLEGGSVSRAGNAQRGPLSGPAQPSNSFSPLFPQDAPGGIAAEAVVEGAFGHSVPPWGNLKLGAGRECRLAQVQVSGISGQLLHSSITFIPASSRERPELLVHIFFII